MAKKRKSKYNFAETFTSTKLRSVVGISHIRYNYSQTGGGRTLTDDKITLSLQRGVEFDVAKELGLYEDSATVKDFNPALKKLVDEGYLKAGTKTKLDPEAFYNMLVEQVNNSANSILYWKDRPIKPEVAALMKANEAMANQLENAETRIQELEKQLKKDGLKV